MECSNPIAPSLVRELPAPPTISEFVRDLHSHGDSDSENEEINITPYGAYRKGKERTYRSASPPPRPIEYWEDLAMEAERSMAAVRFQDIDPPVPVAEETSDVVSVRSSSSGVSEGEYGRPLGIVAALVTSVIAFPITETILQKMDPGATAVYGIGSSSAARRLPNMYPELEQSTAYCAGGHPQHRAHIAKHRNSAPISPMFQAVTETSWARLERSRAQSGGADGHQVGKDERQKGHHGRHKSLDPRRNRHSRELGRPSTSSNNEVAEHQNITGRRPARHSGFDAHSRHSAPLPSCHRRTRSDFVPAENSQQMDHNQPRGLAAFKDRNNTHVYCDVVAGEWLTDLVEGPCGVLAVQQPTSRGAFGKLKAFGGKLARRFKEPKEDRFDLGGVVAARGER
ncbi:uncharacterized protein LAJ45_03562 [Morchella importuna]|uniref:uncharacterized protein n=1 Tax=Morchella importuna TaxID=1174673 RepID=UPI001E8E7891|nr:uncharacterized protein LAJ45_03562 [Morchella importuna]KAH8152136.1 hypothetical protein LAJ45_03562 [Morchella importuna]